jgi:secondary thiamine-phosphate synthase enzyme
MAGLIKRIQLSTRGQGLYEVTRQVSEQLQETPESQGLCSLFIQHTSCSLIIQENADPSARSDLEAWMNRLVPEGDALYTHIFEGKDDMPAHIKSMLTASHLSIPFEQGRLLLGTWQGIFLWEHRHAPHRREIVLHLL